MTVCINPCLILKSLRLMLSRTAFRAADDLNRSTTSYEHVTKKSQRVVMTDFVLTTTPRAHCKDVHLIIMALVIIFAIKQINYCLAL